MQAATATRAAAPPASLRGRAQPEWLRRVLRSRLALPAIVVLCGVVVCAVAATVISPYDPYFQDYASVLEPPSPAHLMGTDDIGRDVLSRVIYGARVSVSVGLVAVALAMLLGVPLGLVAAYGRGWLDDVIMRIMDAIASFPALVLALGITAALRPGLLNVMVAIGVVYTPMFARLARGEALSLREREFISAARVVGAGPLRVIRRHIWPNAPPTIIVLASVRAASAIVT